MYYVTSAAAAIKQEKEDLTKIQSVGFLYKFLRDYHCWLNIY